MIDPQSFWGKVLLVFFWGGLSASFVNMVWSVWHFDPFFIAWAVVIVNMLTVLIKNVLLPSRGR